MKTRVTDEKIIQAAIKLGDQKSLLQFTLIELAGELGIKPPSLYNHIQGLEELYILLASVALKELEEKLKMASIGLAGKEAISAVAAAYLAFAQKNPTLYEAIENPKLPDTTEISAAKSKILDVMLLILRPYQFSDEQTIHIIRSFRSFLHGFALLQKNSLFNMCIAAELSFTKGIDALISGFGL